MDICAALNNTWENARVTGYNVLQAAKKAIGDVDVINNVLRAVSAITKIAKEVFAQIGKMDWLPSPVLALTKAFDVVTDFFGARKWIGDIVSLFTGEAAYRNPIGSFPNIFAITSRAAALVADGITTALWLAKVGVIDPISEQVGNLMMFGKDAASLTSASLDFTDTIRLVAEKGLDFDRGADLVSCAARIGAVASNRVLPGIAAVFASCTFGLVASSVSLIKWAYKAEWTK